jgi:hypothetical protein
VCAKSEVMLLSMRDFYDCIKRQLIQYILS